MANNNPLDLARLYNIQSSKTSNNDTYNGINTMNTYDQQNSLDLERRNMESLRNISNENDSMISESIEASNVPMVRQQVNEQLLPTQMNQNNQGLNLNGDNAEIVDLQDENEMPNLNELMRTQVGRNATIQFSVGDNNLVEKRGRILAVGDDYILLDEEGTGNILVCDFYNIRFVSLNY